MNKQVEHLLENDEFSVWVPNSVEIDLSKSLDDDDEEGGVAKGYKLKGYCSTERRDRQDEVVMQKGLDFNEFVKHGYYNDNHKQDTTAVIGVPTLAEYHTNRGWYTEGYLLKGYPPAEAIAQLAKALADTPRRLGFSIEGKILERGHDNRIVKARVRNVAVTNCPVNTDCTWDLVSKAFAPASEIETSYRKALSAGYQSPGSVGGAALAASSDTAKCDMRLKRNKKKKKRYLLRKGELSLIDAINFLRRVRPEYSDDTCVRIARQFFNHR